jgi:isocitrate dehydrogenase
MTEVFTPIVTLDDFTDELIRVIETVYEGYYADEPRIDWYKFLERVETYALVDLGSSMDSPVVKHIKKLVRGLRAQ